MQILVALATTRSSEEIGARAVEEARASGLGLTLLLVTERDELSQVYQLRCHPAFQGTRTLEDVLREIELEHRRMLEGQALAIEASARDLGVEVETRLAVGDYPTQMALETRRRSYAAVYWLRHNRGFIARFFLGDDADEVVRTTPGPDGHYPPDAFQAG
ncbi:MAG: universal stress protein [Deltaproteobacteria bacterium]|nr:universal stress protein [Deltaproteobacteria bacterium]